MISCDPNSLASLARCFRCLPHSTLVEVRTRLLMYWANTEGANLIPEGAVFGEDLTYALPTDPGSWYRLTQSLTEGGINVLQWGADPAPPERTYTLHHGVPYEFQATDVNYRILSMDGGPGDPVPFVFIEIPPP